MCSALHAGPDELVLEVDRVRHARGEHDRLAAIGVTMPVADDVTDELGPIDARGELMLDVVAMR